MTRAWSLTCSVCWAVCPERCISVHTDIWRNASRRRATADHDSAPHNDPPAWSTCNYTGGKSIYDRFRINTPREQLFVWTSSYLNLTRYLFTGNGTTLHLSDALHLLLHLLLFHQRIKVALLHLVLRLRGTTFSDVRHTLQCLKYGNAAGCAEKRTACSAAPWRDLALRIFWNSSDWT